MEEIKKFFREYHCYVTVLLIAMNVVWFLYMYFTGGHESSEGMLACGAMMSDTLEKKEYFRIVSAFFVHFDIRHLGNNMILLLAIGAMLEQHAGSICFLIIYIFSGIGGNIVSVIWHVGQEQIVLSAGASGAVFGIVGGFLAALLLNRGRIQNMTAQKLLIFAVLTLYQGFASQGIDNAAHVGGFVCGLLTAAVCELFRKLVKKEQGASI